MISQIRDQAALMSFIDDLIVEKQDPAINEKNLPKIRNYLLEKIYQAINTRLVTVLSFKDQQELERLLDQDPTDKELNNFFEKKIPNLEAEIAIALLNFRAQYLTNYSIT